MNEEKAISLQECNDIKMLMEIINPSNETWKQDPAHTVKEY